MSDDTSKSGNGAANPNDYSRFVLPQDFTEAIPVKKALTTVRVRKPHRHEWVQVHSGGEWTATVGLFSDKNDGEQYLVEPNMLSELRDEIRRAALYATISRQGAVFLWPVVLPGADGKWNDWHRSAAEAVKLARSKWVRVVSNRAAGGYDVELPQAELPDPEWPEADFGQLIGLAFRDRIIDSEQHPVLLNLRGVR